MIYRVITDVGIAYFSRAAIDKALDRKREFQRVLDANVLPMPVTALSFQLVKRMDDCMYEGHNLTCISVGNQAAEWGILILENTAYRLETGT